MSSLPDVDFTILLARYRDGEDALGNVLITMVYGDLRRIASHHMRGNKWIATLNPTVLVNEVYFRLLSPSAKRVTSKAHFLSLAAMAMRQIICDYARKRMRENQNVEKSRDVNDIDDDYLGHEQAKEILWLHDALKDLAKVNGRAAKVVECRFFGGLSEDETAKAIGLSRRTVERAWAEARSWLERHLTSA